MFSHFLLFSTAVSFLFLTGFVRFCFDWFMWFPEVRLIYNVILIPLLLKISPILILTQVLFYLRYFSIPYSWIVRLTADGLSNAEIDFYRF